MTLLEQLKPRHARLAGAFYPHSYAMGLPGGLSGMKLMDYPLANTGPDQIDEFAASLSFIHECTHFSQFICSSFGLELARVTNIVQNILLTGGQFNPPILKAPLDQIDGEQLDRIAGYLFLTESLVSHCYERSVEDESQFDKSIVVVQPTSPAVSMVYHDQHYPGADTAIALTMECRQRVINQPHVIRTDRNGKSTEVVLNTAALMEGFAYLTVVNHIANALQMGLEEFVTEGLLFDLFNPINTAAAEYFISARSEFPNFFLHEFAAVIDLALMYSPHLIHNIGPTHAVDAGGSAYRMPCETFCDACAAMGEVTSIRSTEPEEVQRFQDDLCRVLKIPTTPEMTELCLQTLHGLGITDQEAADSYSRIDVPIHAGRMFAAHWYGLELRRLNPTAFFTHQMASDGIVAVMEFSKDICTLFDLNTKQPVNLAPNRLSHACLHHLIWDTLYKSRSECPLKFGKPFYCPSSELGTDQLCTFAEAVDGQPGAIIGECPLDIFENTVRRNMN